LRRLQPRAWLACVVSIPTFLGIATGDPCVLHEIAEVVPDAPAPLTKYGWSLDCDGARLVVGDVGDPSRDYIGAAYVFRLDDKGTSWDLTDDQWMQEGKLIASDGSFNHSFGKAVSISGDWIVVASRHNQFGSSSGSAYMFRREDAATPADPSDDAWVEHQKLIASDAVPDARFGDSLSLDGDWLVIGAPQCARGAPCPPGSAYVFVRSEHGTPSDLSDDQWLEHATLEELNGSEANSFGSSVNLFRNRIAVGCPGNDDRATNAGAVFVFLRDDRGTPFDSADDQWLLEATLTASDAAPWDVLGVGLAMSADTIVAGATFDEHKGVVSGSAYVYRLDDAGTPQAASDDTWGEAAKLLPSDGQEFDEFGWPIALNGDQILVAAHHHHAYAANKGAAYLFRRNGNSWVEAVQLKSRNSPSGVLGYAVGLSGELAIVGAPFRGKSPTGAVYVFPTGRDCVSLLEFAAFQNCLGTVAAGVCEAFDFEPNAVIDLVDYRQLILTLTGP